ncbi:unnamed protein product, partial [Mesorhabditis spiculigera]
MPTQDEKKLPRALFVAKNNVMAKRISALLSKDKAVWRDGPSPFNKIYSFSMHFQGRETLISVTSVSGHLMCATFGYKLKEWHESTAEKLFNAPLLYWRKEKVAQNVKDEAARSNVLVILTECDREGENIGAQIKIVCQEANPYIHVFRAKFSAVTTESLERALENLHSLDKNIVEAVNCRMEFDLRIGSAFSRLQTLYYRRYFPAQFPPDDPKVVSYGSCQFPTLGFVVEREKVIQRFVVKSVWKLRIDHVKDGVKTEFTWNGKPQFNAVKARRFYTNARTAARAIVEMIYTYPTTKPRPSPLNKADLQKLAIKQLGMTAHEVTAVAEQLYLRGLISNPKTNTNIFHKGMELNSVLALLVSDASWGAFAQKIIDDGGAMPRKESQNDGVHPPIHPLRLATRDEFSCEVEWRVYELVARHFLACCSKDAKGQETRVTIRLGEESFTATGLHVDDRGYLEVYPYENWDEKSIGKYDHGETITDYQIRMIESKTEPPPLLTEADLITLMDENGIGTSATHSQHIQTIKNREYVMLDGNQNLCSTVLGRSLVEAYENMGLPMASPGLHADFERQLVKICEGKRTKEQVLSEYLAMYRRMFRVAEEQIHEFGAAFYRNTTLDQMKLEIPEIIADKSLENDENRNWIQFSLDSNDTKPPFPNLSSQLDTDFDLDWQ